MKEHSGGAQSSQGTTLNANGRRNDNVANIEIPCAQTPQSHCGSNNMRVQDEKNQDTPSDGLVKKKYKVLSWQKNVVAEGTIASIDSDASVHFVKLGPDAWKVWMNVVVELEDFLYRPNSEMITIKEAVGSTVAWHKDFISMV